MRHLPRAAHHERRMRFERDAPVGDDAGAQNGRITSVERVSDATGAQA
jgi:hypothetical protein